MKLIYFLVSRSEIWASGTITVFRGFKPTNRKSMSEIDFLPVATISLILSGKLTDSRNLLRDNCVTLWGTSCVYIHPVHRNFVGNRREKDLCKRIVPSADNAFDLGASLSVTNECIPCSIYICFVFSKGEYIKLCFVWCLVSKIRLIRQRIILIETFVLSIQKTVDSSSAQEKITYLKKVTVLDVYGNHGILIS